MTQPMPFRRAHLPAALPSACRTGSAANPRPEVHARALPLALTLLLACLGIAPRAFGGDLYVVCASGVSLSMAEVRDVFLGEKQFAGSVKLAPADNAAAQADFLDKVMKMDSAKYQTAWTKKSFRDGSSAPPTKANDGEAVEYVKHTPGGCSYTASAPPAGLTVIGKL
jgi:hypothetical protein